MTTYERTKFPFPAGAMSLMQLFDGSTGSPVGFLNSAAGSLLGNVASFGKASITLTDGTTIELNGSGTNIDVSGNVFTLSGSVDSIVHVITGLHTVLEVVDGFTANFTVTADGGQISPDFSDFASLFAADDHVNGGSLDDLLKGFGGNDTIVGDDGRDMMFGGSGRDHLRGGAGNDKLIGGNGADHLSGNRGADVLLGGTGRDVLNGNAGNDMMRGGAGLDTFVFDNGFGHDTIADFSTVNREKIDLSQVTAITGFFDLVHHHLHAGPGGFAEIDVGGANSILLHGICADEVGHGLAVSAADFIF